MRKKIYWVNNILFHHIIGPNLQLLHDGDKKEEIQKTLEHMLRVYGVYLHCAEL